MKPSALRVEFVISGTAFFLALYGGWLAVRRLLEKSPLNVEDWLGVDPTHSTAEALLFTADSSVRRSPSGRSSSSSHSRFPARR